MNQNELNTKINELGILLNKNQHFINKAIETTRQAQDQFSKDITNYNSLLNKARVFFRLSGGVLEDIDKIFENLEVIGGEKIEKISNE